MWKMSMNVNNQNSGEYLNVSMEVSEETASPLLVVQKGMNNRQAASVTPPTRNAVGAIKHAVKPGKSCTEPGRDAGMPSVHVDQAQHKKPLAQHTPEVNRCASAKNPCPWSLEYLAKQKKHVSSSSSDSDDERYDLVNSGKNFAAKPGPWSLEYLAKQKEHVSSSSSDSEDERYALVNSGKNFAAKPGLWSLGYLDKQKEHVSSSSSESGDERYALVDLGDERYDEEDSDDDEEDSDDERYDIVDPGNAVVEEDTDVLATNTNERSAGMDRNVPGRTAVNPSVQAGQLRNICQAPHIYAANRSGPWSLEYLARQKEDVSTSDDEEDSEDERYDIVRP